MKLTPGLIYEAALDDELFGRLPSVIADAIGARSCVLHWRTRSGAAEIFTHSGYFSDQEMENYATNFAAHDLWTDAGMRQGRMNQAWNITSLVSTSDYERSIFYNDWIRAMGDDTYYCAGSVMQTVHGLGIIGLHRGRTQENFSADALSLLNEHTEHLRRMFAIRGRLATLTDRHDLLDQIFAAGQDAAFVLTAGGRVLMANAAGDALLRSGRFLESRNGILKARVEEDGRALDAARAAASRPGDPRASDCLLRSIEGESVVASTTPLMTGRAAVLLTIAASRRRLPRDVLAAHLQRNYGLSGAEADVALRLADGQTVQAIGDGRGSTIGTVRTQVKHAMSKMDVTRQTDLIRKIVAIS